MNINKVGVLGCGLMGSRIAQVCATAGFDTTVFDVDQNILSKGLVSVEKSFDKTIEKGKMTADEKSAIMKRLHGTGNLGDLRNCDFIIEAILEDLKLKSSTYQELNKICPAHTIFATNTSSLTVISIAAESGRPDRFLGLHFFNPAHAMKLVEVVKTVATSDETLATTMDFARKIGKEPVLAKDKCGFIVNRLLIPYMLDAIRVFEQGMASMEDIDKAMELGCAHPMGPLKLTDFVGLDTTFRIANIMFEEYREQRFAPPSLLKNMVIAGYLGQKSGRGFYDYTNKDKIVPNRNIL